VQTFSPAQAIVIRERLIRYLLDQKRLGSISAEFDGRPVRVGTPQVLEEIIRSKHTSYIVPPEHDHETKSKRRYDHYYELKDDGLGAFLARRQERLEDRHLREIANFLIGENYLSENDMDEIRALESIEIPITISRPQVDHLDRLPTLGEYIAIVDTVEPAEIRSIAFSRLPKTKIVKTIHRDTCLNNSLTEYKRHWRDHALWSGKLTMSFSGAGICVVPNTQNAYIIAFTKSGKSLQFEINLSNTGLNIGEVTRGNYLYQLTEDINEELSDLFLEIKNYSNIMEFHGVIAVNDLWNQYQFSKYRPLYQVFLRSLIPIRKSKKLEINWNREFILACQSLDLPAVVQAINFGADVLTVSERSGNSALHWAAIHGSPELYFLASGNHLSAQPRAFEIIGNLEKETGRRFSALKRKRLNRLVLLRNAFGLLPSACIPNITLSAKSAASLNRRDFFYAMVKCEYNASKMNPSEFVDWLAEISGNGPIYPNIIRTFD
jgi:hypothetical protein